MPWVFERFHVARVHANVFDFNTASARVLEKAGFTLLWAGLVDSDDPEDVGPSRVYGRFRAGRAPGAAHGFELGVTDRALLIARANQA